MDMMHLKELLEKEGVLISFSGKISQEIVTSLCETVEKELIAMDVRPKTIQNIFGIVIEQMQNIMSYSKERLQFAENRYIGFGLTLVGQDEKNDKYFVHSGNFMNIQDREKLETKLEKINSLDEQGLKEYYRELRKSGRNKHERGAGLGFLEMKKKSSEPLEYTIEPVDKDSAFFSIKVYI